MDREIYKDFPLYKISVLKSLLDEDKVWFQKSKSQNFLVDKNYINKIFDSMVQFKDRNFMEIGGGSGNISLILAILAKRLRIFEIDRYFSSLLSYIFGFINSQHEGFEKYLSKYVFHLKNFLKDNNKEIEVINKDFLEINNDVFKDDNKYIIFGNIPYNISTQIIIKISKIKSNLESIFMTTQKEYFERITGKTEKSFFTIFCQYHFEIKKIFDIPPTAFYPKPKIYSTFFMLSPKKIDLNLEDEIRFFSFVSKCFSNKRKILLNNFKENEIQCNKLKDILNMKKLNLNLRAEELSLNQFQEIFTLLKESSFFNI